MRNLLSNRASWFSSAASSANFASLQKTLLRICMLALCSAFVSTRRRLARIDGPAPLVSSLDVLIKPRESRNKAFCYSQTHSNASK